MSCKEGWAGLTKEKMAKARKCRLPSLVSEAKSGGLLRNDEAYMRGVTDKGQEG